MLQVWKAYRRALSFFLALVMVVSIITPATQRAEAKADDQPISAEYVLDADSINMSLETEPILNAGLSIQERIMEARTGLSSRVGMVKTGLSGLISPLTASPSTYTFGYGKSSKDFSISGRVGTLRAERLDGAGWFSASASGSTVTVSVLANTGGKRTGRVEVVDMGNGSRVIFSFTQSAKPTPTPTKKPTKKPTPTPTKKPTKKPTPTPTKKPTPTPTKKPTATPTPKLTASPTSLSFSSGSGSKTVSLGNVYGTSKIRVDRNQAATAFVTVSGSGSTYTVSVSANNSHASRSGKITFTDTTNGRYVDVTVSQAGMPSYNPTKSPTPTKKPTPTPTKKPTPTPTKKPTPTPTKKPTATPTPKLTASPSSISFTCSAGSKTVTLGNVYGTSKIRVDRSQAAMAFVTVSGSGSSYTVSVIANNSHASRSGKITFTDTTNGRYVDVTVSQAGMPSYEPTKSPTPTKKPTPTPTKKPTPTPTKKPTVTPTPKLTANPSSMSFSSGAGSKTVTLGNVYGTSKIRVDRSQAAMAFVTVSGSGSTYTVTVIANNSHASRSGKITFTDTSNGRYVDVTVSQAGMPSYEPTKAPTPTKKPTPTPTKKPTATPTPKLTANPSSMSFTSGAGSKTVSLGNVFGTSKISVNRSQAAMAFVNVSGSGSTYTVSVIENNSYASRSGKITFTDTTNGRYVDVTVSQSGMPSYYPTKPANPTATPTPKLTAKPSYLSFSNVGGSQKVTLENVANPQKICVDRSQAAMAFVTVKGSGTEYTITVDANTSYAARNGKVSFTDTSNGQSVSVTVSQTGAPSYYTPTATPTPSPTPRLEVNPSSLLFTKEKSSETVTLKNVTSESKIRVDCNTDAMGWVTVTGSGTTYTVSVLANLTNELRKGTVTFTDTSNGRYVNLIVNQSDKNFCHVTFDVNGGSGQMYMQAKSVAQGTSMSGIFPSPAPNPPANKVFGGWYDKDGKLYDDNSTAPFQKELKLYARWKDRNYVIVFDRNGAENGVMENLPAVTNKDVQLPIHKFVKTGYVFDYWSTNKNGTGKRFEDGGVYPSLIDPYAQSSTVTLYAQWSEAVEVEVSFDVRGGNGKEHEGKMRKTVIYKEKYGTLPSGLTHPNGLIFDGWETKDGRRILPSTQVTTKENHTLYARWRPNTFTIHFDGNGNISGSTNDIECSYEGRVKFPECGYDDGVMFGVWGTKPDGSGLNFPAGSTANVDVLTELIPEKWHEITLYAVWDDQNVTIEYYDGFSSALYYTADPSEVVHKYYPKTGKQISGMRFVGWATRRPIGPAYFENTDPKDMIFWDGQPAIVTQKKGKLKVYAIYEPIVREGQVGVTYCSRGGTNVPGVTYYNLNKTGTTRISVTKDEPSWDRHWFLGWGLDPDGGRYVTEVEASPRDKMIVLYANWADIYANITLNDGYSGSKQYPVAPDNPYYTLREISRDDYNFLGWKAADGTEYKAHQKVFVPEGGITLTAQWERRKYTLEFIDFYSGKTLFEDDFYSDAKIPETIYPISGKVFQGWTSDSNPFKVFAPGTVVSDIVLTYGAKDHYKLRTSYITKDGVRKDGQFTVFYYLNGGTGGPTEPTYGNLATGMAVTSDIEPTRKGCKFTGWSTVLGGKAMCKAGEAINCSNRPLTEEATLYACWESIYKGYLDSNDYSGAKMTRVEIKALPGDTINLSNYKKAFGDPAGEYLLGWSYGKQYASYGIDSDFTIPYRDFTLYAIWRLNEYHVEFRDSFSGKLYDSVTVFGQKTIDVPDYPEARNQDGYEFTGWSTNSDRLGYPIYRPNGKIYVTQDIVLYATYELSKVDENLFTIRYMPNGGSGGPRVKTYQPGTIVLDDKEPKWDGYTFLGWDTRNVFEDFVPEPEYPVDKRNTVRGTKGGEMILFAVWQRNSSNPLKDELRDHYNNSSAFKDEFFDKPYESKNWEKINDKAYYVVRTINTSRTLLYPNMDSTVMVMEYRNGKWFLKGYGTNETPWNAVRLDILCSKTNSEAEVTDFLFELANAVGEAGVAVVSVYCPAVGVVVDIAHYSTIIANIVQKWGEYEDLKEYLIEEGCDLADGKIVETLAKHCFGEGVPGAIASSAVSLFKATEIAIRKEVASGAKGKDPFGEYDKAISLFESSLKSNRFCKTIRDNVPKVIAEIYKHVNYGELRR